MKPATNPAAVGHDGPVLSVQGLKAYYRTRHFGVEREVRAVDGIDFEVQRNEIYGLAGESSSGKTTLCKTIAAACSWEHAPTESSWCRTSRRSNRLISANAP